MQTDIIISNSIEDVFAGSSSFKFTGVSHRESVGRNTLGRFSFPIEVHIFVHSSNHWSTFPAIVSKIFAFQAFREQNRVRAIFWFGSHTIHLEWLVETSHEVAGKFTSGITLITHTSGVCNITFDFVSFRDYTEEVFEFTTRIINYDMCLFGSRESKSQDAGFRYTCQFGLDVVVFQHHRIIIRLSYFLVVRIVGGTFVRTGIQLTYQRHDGNGSIFGHGGTVRVVAGAETLKQRVRRIIGSVGLYRLRSELHHRIGMPYPGIYKAFGLFGSTEG